PRHTGASAGGGDLSTGPGSGSGNVTNMPARLAIDLGGTAIKVGVLDRAGTVLVRDQFDVAGEPGDLDRAATLARRLLDSRGADADAVGSALPGVVDRAAGTLVRAHDKYTFLGDPDLRAWGRQEFGAPTVIENDARAALLGETSYGC